MILSFDDNSSVQTDPKKSPDSNKEMNDSNSPPKKNSIIQTKELNIKLSQSPLDFETWKNEDDFIQKDLLHMINSISGSSPEDIMPGKQSTFNEYFQNQIKPNDYDYDDYLIYFEDREDNKVINIQLGNSFDKSRGICEQQQQQKQKHKKNKKTKDNQFNQTDANNSLTFSSKCQTSTEINKKNVKNYMSLTNHQLAKCAYLLTKDQKSCIFLQEKLDKEPEMIELLYINLKRRIIDMMFGGFSNYLIQKLIEKLPNKYVKEIIYQIIQTNSFAILGLDPHGTRVMQKIIKKIKGTNQLIHLMTSSILKNLGTFLIDANANHIIIQFTTILGSPLNQVIYDYLFVHILAVSQNKNGCFALQKCILVATDKQKEELFMCIARNAKAMLTDAFGNYVLQFIIPLCGGNVLNDIIQSFSDTPDLYALNKYASNVIEKCIENCDNDLRKIIIKEYLNEPSITSMLSNKYGKYVLNAIITYSPESILETVFSFIRMYIQKGKQNQGTQFFLFQIKSKYPQYFQMRNNFGWNNNSLPQSKHHYNQISFNQDYNQMMSYGNNSISNACFSNNVDLLSASNEIMNPNNQNSNDSYNSLTNYSLYCCSNQQQNYNQFSNNNYANSYNNNHHHLKNR